VYHFDTSIPSYKSRSYPLSGLKRLHQLIACLAANEARGNEKVLVSISVWPLRDRFQF